MRSSANSGKLILMAAVVCLTSAVFAQTAPDIKTTSTPGKVSVAGTLKTTSTIVGIEPATRTVWLKDPKGKVVEVVVGDEARNFEQLKIGDVVNAEYSQAITVTLKKGGGAASANENQTLERAPMGAKPGGAASREVTIMANVTAVNHQTGAMTLKGPQGNSLDVVVEDPEQLKLIRKGDQLEVVYHEALAISVEPQAK